MAQFAIDEILTTGIQISGFVFDVSNNIGTNGYVLTSTSSGVMWQQDSNSADLSALSGQIAATGSLLNNRINSLSGYANDTFLSGSGVANYVARWSNTKELITGSIYDLGTGVGIGTTSPVSLLTVGAAGSTSAANGISFGGDVSANLFRDSNASIATDGGFYAAGRIRSADYIQFNSNLYSNAFTNPIDINVGNSAGNAWLSAIRFNQGGYVGIGTNQPSGKLHVVSSIAGETVLRADGTNGTLFSVTDDLSDSLMSVNNSAGLPVFEVFADDRVIAGQYGSGDFVLKNNNIGIGTTNPSQKLNVVGSTLFSNSSPSQYVSLIMDDGVSTPVKIGTTLRVVNDGSSPDYSVFEASSSVSNFVILNNGDVGIGTSQPNAKLHVSGSNGHVLYLNQGVTGAQGGLYFQNVDQFALSSARLYFISGDSILFTRGASNLAWAVSQNANVGIGVSNPSEKLTITGAVKILTRDGANFKVGDGSNNPTFLEFDYPDISTSNAYFRIFRNTNTAGGKYFQIFKGDGTATSQTLLNANGDSHINAIAGNLGIGTDSPNHLLNLNTVTADTSIGLYTSNANSNARNWLISANDLAYGDFSLRQSLAISGNPRTSGVSRFYINNNGNIGIATTSPGYSLQIGQNASGNNIDYSLGILRHGTLTYPGSWTSNPAFKITDLSDGGPSNVDIYGLINLELPRFQASDTNAEKASLFLISFDTALGPFRIDGKGNTWIGYDRVVTGVNNSSFSSLIYGGLAVGDAYQTTTLSNGQAIFQGNVGIGITNPGVRLQVVNTGAVTSTSTVRIVGATGNGGGSQIEFFKGASQKFSIGTASAITGGFSDDLLLTTLNPSSIILTAGLSGLAIFKTDGKVGIGMYNPISLLSIAGTGSTSAASGITFGLDPQANLYRSAEGTVKTDGSLIIGTDLYVADELGVGVPIANKRFSYGAQIEVASASIQLVLSRGATATGQGAIGADANNTFAVWNISGGIAKQFVISQQGNVGIGTDIPSSKLSVSGSIESLNDNGAEGGQLILRGNTYRYNIDNYLGQGLRFFREDDATTANGLVLMQISSGGNVGINNSTPGSLLDIRFPTNPATDNGAGNNVLRLWTSATANTDVGGAIGLGGQYSGGLFQSFGQIAGRKSNATLGNNAGYLQFATTNNGGTMNEWMRIDAGGSVGIGTSAPTYQLTVIGANQATANLTDAGAKGGSILVGSSTNASNQGGAVLFATKNDNNTYTPQSAIKSLFLNGMGYGLGDLAFSSRLATGDTNLTEVLRIKYDGKVGIGTTNPNEKLEVQGNIQVGNDSVTNVGLKITRLNGGMRTSEHTYHSSQNSPWYTYGQNLTWTNELAGTVESTQAYRPYVEGFAPAAGYKIFGFMNVNTGSFTSANLINSLVLKNDGNVGINTTNPTQKLEVSGIVKIQSLGAYSDPTDNAAFLNYDTNGGIFTLSARSNAGNTYMAFRTSNGGTGNERVRIANNGFVGISSNIPTDFLDFGGAGKNIVFGYAAYGEVLNSAASIIGNNVKASPTANSQVRRFANANDQGNFIKLIYNKGVTFHTNITSALNTDISEDTNERMRIDLSGNVGIGTISPSGRLHIVETTPTGTRIQLGTNIENASMNAGLTNDLLILNAPYGTNSATVSNSGAKWGIKFIGTLEANQFNSTRKTSAIYAVSEDPTAGYNRGTSLAFYTNAWFDQEYTERMRIFQNGNIGIGTTQPSYKLQIVGSGTPTSPTVLQVAGLNDAGGDAKLIVSQNPGASDLQLLVAGTDTRSDGFTANDQYILAGQQLNLFNRGNGSTYNTQIMIGRDGGYGNISFSTAPQSQTAVVRMYIASGGNVGIGTITPSKLLHVHGDSGEILRLSMPSNYTAGAGPQLSFWHRGDEELASIRGVFNETSQGNRANLLFGTRTSDVLGVETKMTILHNGNVGIGNTIPTGLLNVVRNLNTAQPIAFFKELFGTPPATNILLLERGNNLTAANQLSSNAGLRIRDHLANYSLSVEDHNSNVNFAISGARVMLGSRGTSSLLNIGGASSTAAASGITFGEDAQVNLYRSAEDTLRTDAAFTNGNITLLGGDLLFASDGGGDGFQFDYYQGKMYIGNYGATAWHMVIQDNGYVGIGTTQPTGKLHVVSTVAGETVLRADGTNGTLFSVVDDLSDSLMSVNNSAGLPVLEVFADDRVVAGQYGSGDLVVSSNKVGIGRTSPGEKLDVNGSIRLGVTVSNTIGTSAVSSLQTQAINIQPNSSTDTLYIRNLSAGNYQLQTVTASANGGNLHLQPYGGNVGIGTTNPSSKLHIYDNGGSFRTDLDATYHMGIFNEYVSTYVTRTKFGRYSNTSNLEIYYDIAGTEEARITRNLSTAVLKFNRSSTTDMIIDGVGNVGIGTNAPTNTLQVVGQIAIKGNESADNAKIYIQASDNSNRYTVETDLDGNTNNDLLIFRSNTADNMLVLKGNGNIGINTTNPADKIHISGGGISFTSSTGLAIPMLGVTATNVAYVGPYTTTAEGVSPSLVLFNQGASVQQTWFYSSGRVAMVLNKEGRLHIGNTNNTPNCLLSVGPSSSTTAVSGMCFGNDAEANLYRSAEDTIKTDGNLIVVGNVTAANLVSGNGTANYITKWNGTKSIANSQIFDDGTYVGVNTAVNTTYRLQVNGSFAATTKSFDITHPTISGKRLVYASLEGPENGVYFRGRNNNNEINLPHYWSGLVHDDSITVDLTSVGKRKDGRIRNYSVDQIGHNKVYIYTDSDDNIYDYYYTIFAERKDVSKLVIERDME
jgi:hypothetical protein